MKSLPREVFVRIERVPNGTDYLVAFVTHREAVEDDGPTNMGVYHLVRKLSVRKRVEVRQG